MSFPAVALEDPLRSRASDAAHIISCALRDSITSQAPSREVGWADSSLACGYPSLLILFDEMAYAFPAEDWPLQARKQLSLLARATRVGPISHSGLYGGAAGVASALRRLSERETGLRSVVAELDCEIVRSVHEQPTLIGVDPQEDFYYDIISGRAGVLSYLLTTTSRSKETVKAIEFLISELIWMSTLVEGLPKRALIVARGTARQNSLARAMPDGYYDLGMAHGLPGVLAALSMAISHGYGGTAARTAAYAASEWLIEQIVRDRWGPCWPLALPRAGAPGSPGQARAGWCYGTAGISRSLWLAAEALQSGGMRQLAIASMQAGLRRLAKDGPLDSVTLCHGTSGVLAACYAFSLDGVRIEGLKELMEQTLRGFSTKYQFGVRDTTSTGEDLDDPGLLTGAAGVALILLAVSTGMRADWLHLMAMR